MKQQWKKGWGSIEGRRHAALLMFQTEYKVTPFILLLQQQFPLSTSLTKSLTMYNQFYNFFVNMGTVNDVYSGKNGQAPEVRYSGCFR